MRKLQHSHLTEHVSDDSCHPFNAPYFCFAVCRRKRYLAVVHQVATWKFSELPRCPSDTQFLECIQGSHLLDGDLTAVRTVFPSFIVLFKRDYRNVHEQ